MSQLKYTTTNNNITLNKCYFANFLYFLKGCKTQTFSKKKLVKNSFGVIIATINFYSPDKK